MRMPVLFIGHGAPMNAIRDSMFTHALRLLGKKLPKPKAVLAISAHWETKFIRISNNPKPNKINDFFGDHPDLFSMQYAPEGAPLIAQRTQMLIEGSELTEEQGLDHGIWSIAVHLFPHADVPIYQMSISKSLSNKEHYFLGQRLQILREEGILILTSGNICHNLKQINANQFEEPYPWNVQFDTQIAQALLLSEYEKIFNYKDVFPDSSKYAVPTPEHFIPLFYAIGSVDAEDKMSFLFEGYEHAAISLRSIIWE